MPGDKTTRILFVNHWAHSLGGAEWSLLELLEEASSRAEVFLITSEEGALVNRARAFGVTCTVVPCSARLGNVRRAGLLIGALREWRGMLSFFAFVFRVRRLVVETGPDLIHANVPKSHVTLFLLRMLGYRGRCCFHMRELFEKGSIPWRLYGALFRPQRCRVIAISQAVQASLPPAMARSGAVIHNGVTIGRPRTYEAEAGRPLRFVYLGRVVPWKGCHHLIKTFARFHARCGEKAGILDLIGDTLYWDQEYRSELQAIIGNKDIGRVCRLLPHTDDPLATLSRYDVFCIASIQEPFGRVVAEAQGCGLPVIAYDDGGIGEIVKQESTGMLVRAGDTEGFVAAMARFIEAPGLVAQMGAAARERAARLFDRMIQREKIVDYLLHER